VQYSRQFGANEFNEFVMQYQLSSFMALRTSLSDVVYQDLYHLFGPRDRAGVDLVFVFTY
jgi:hypothetical protein